MRRQSNHGDMLRRGPAILRDVDGLERDAPRHSPSHPGEGYYAPAVVQAAGYRSPPPRPPRSGSTVLAWRERMQTKRRPVMHGASGVLYLDRPPTTTPLDTAKLLHSSGAWHEAVRGALLPRSHHELLTHSAPHPAGMPYRPPRPQHNPRQWFADVAAPYTPAFGYHTRPY
jgi:hypothetical protein